LKNKSLMHISRSPRVLNLNLSIRFKDQKLMTKYVVKLLREVNDPFILQIFTELPLETV